MPSTIYALADEAGEVRYIGKTVKKLSERLSHHLHIARKGDDESYRSRWIRTLTKPPAIHALLAVTDQEAASAERLFIAEFRGAGARLVNLTDGGEGNLGWKPSAETRARISSKRRGQKPSPEAIAKTALAKTGQQLSPEHRAKVLAKLADPHVRAKISAGVKAARARKHWNNRPKVAA